MSLDKKVTLYACFFSDLRRCLSFFPMFSDYTFCLPWGNYVGCSTFLGMCSEMRKLLFDLTTCKTTELLLPNQIITDHSQNAAKNNGKFWSPKFVSVLGNGGKDETLKPWKKAPDEMVRVV